VVEPTMASTVDALHRAVKTVLLTLTGWSDTEYESESHTQSRVVVCGTFNVNNVAS